jgi:hypothetical protein
VHRDRRSLRPDGGELLRRHRVRAGPGGRPSLRRAHRAVVASPGEGCDRRPAVTVSRPGTRPARR